MSFLVIGAIWINHHAMFKHIVRMDGTLLLLNVLHTDEPIVAAFYGGILTILGFFINVMWQYAARGHRLISNRGLTPFLTIKYHIV